MDLANEDFRNNRGPPDKRKVELNEERWRHDIWNLRFQDPLSQANIEQFKNKVKIYEEQGHTLDQAVHHAANNDLPYLRKSLGQEYTRFLIDFLRVTKRSYSAASSRIGDIQKPARYESGESIRQAVKLKKDLFVDVLPNHSLDQEPLKKDDDVKGSEEE